MLTFCFPYRQAEILRKFHEWDKDCNGVITRDEVMMMYSELGNLLTKYEFEDLMALLDKDQDGVVRYEEFASGIYCI